MTGRFLRCERASAAIEGAIAIFVLVSAFAGLMEIVNTVYTEDQMGRGARTVARALALNPSADPWEALGREIDLNAASCSVRSDGEPTDSAPGNKCDADCTVCDEWKLAFDRGVSPGTLAVALGVDKGDVAPGEMILVRLLKSRDPWSFMDVVPSAQAAPQTTSTQDGQSGDDNTSKSALRGDGRHRPGPQRARGLSRCAGRCTGFGRCARISPPESFPGRSPFPGSAGVPPARAGGPR